MVVSSVLSPPISPSPAITITFSTGHSHSLQQPNTRQQQRADAHTAQYLTPLKITDLARVIRRRNAQSGADDPDKTEDAEVEPAGLAVHAVPEDDKDGEE